MKGAVTGCVSGSMDHPAMSPPELQGISISEQAIRFAHFIVAHLYENFSPLFSLILTLRTIAIDEVINVLKHRSVGLGYPHLGFRKKVIVYHVVFMAVTHEEDLNGSFLVDGFQDRLAACRIDQSSPLSVNKDRVAVGIPFAANEFD
jgi:hypothetical protein